jgi:ankyrin repeat protein
LDAGANVNSFDAFGISPLAKACARGNVEMVRLFLARGGNPNLKDQAGKTPLIHFVDSATSSAATDIVGLLIAAGGDVNTTDRAGRSAIDIARARNRTDIVALLSKTK